MLGCNNINPPAEVVKFFLCDRTSYQPIFNTNRIYQRKS